MKNEGEARRVVGGFERAASSHGLKPRAATPLDNSLAVEEEGQRGGCPFEGRFAASGFEANARVRILSSRRLCAKGVGARLRACPRPVRTAWSWGRRSRVSRSGRAS